MWEEDDREIGIPSIVEKKKRKGQNLETLQSGRGEPKIQGDSGHII